MSNDADTTAETIPIRRITLYRSGVGYFERHGAVQGNQEIRLRFSTDHVNDILKSMVLLDLDGGRIEGVQYGSKEPLERRLASFGVNIASNPGIAELLNQLRGAPVRLMVAGASVSGTVLGVERRLTAPGKDVEPIEVPHVNLVTETGLRSVAITDVSSFEIQDASLAEELNKALAALAEYRADRTKTVEVRLSGDGQRRVVIGYVHEMPVWKTSYRLVLPEAEEAEASGRRGAEGNGAPSREQGVIQGWAIVENTTDQDWDDVRLSLVSGRPVSFRMDLYEPLFTYRPLVPVPTIPGVMPRQYAGGSAVEELRQAMNQAKSGRGAPPATQSSMGSGQSPFEDGRDADAAEHTYEYRLRERASASDMVDYAAAAAARAGEVGEVFQYELAAPVTVERQRSAMLPILSGNIDARRVSIYNRADGAEYPMRGVELKNQTDLQLLPGPISVFDGAAYAGDAQIGHVGRGDTRLLAYSADLDVRVLAEDESAVEVVRVRIADGSVLVTQQARHATRYAFDNNDRRRGRAIVLEHPKLGGYTLAEPAEAKEETADLYRFEIPLEPDGTATLEIAQERIDRQAAAVTSLDLPTVLAYHRDGKVSDAVLDVFRRVADQQAAINAAERRIAELDRQISEITAEQSRIRSNMGSIDRNSQLYERYMTKLTEQETQMEALRQARGEAGREAEGLRSELNRFLRGLTVE